MFQITAFREHAQKFLSISYDDHDILRKSEVENKIGPFLLLPFSRICWNKVLQAVETKKSL